MSKLDFSLLHQVLSASRLGYNTQQKMIDGAVSEIRDLRAALNQKGVSYQARVAELIKQLDDKDAELCQLKDAYATLDAQREKAEEAHKEQMFRKCESGRHYCGFGQPFNANKNACAECMLEEVLQSRDVLRQTLELVVRAAERATDHNDADKPSFATVECDLRQISGTAELVLTEEQFAHDDAKRKFGYAAHSWLNASIGVGAALLSMVGYFMHRKEK